MFFFWIFLCWNIPCWVLNFDHTNVVATIPVLNVDEGSAIHAMLIHGYSHIQASFYRTVALLRALGGIICISLSKWWKLYTPQTEADDTGGPGALHLDTRLKPQESMRKLMDVGCCRMFFGFQHWDSSCIGCPQTHLFIKTVCRRCPSSSLVATSLALSGTSGICTAINSTVGNASWNGASKCGAPHTKLTRTPQMWWQMLVISRWIQVFWKMSHKISPWIHGTSTIWGSYRNMMEYVDILYDFFLNVCFAAKKMRTSPGLIFCNSSQLSGSASRFLWMMKPPWVMGDRVTCSDPCWAIFIARKTSTRTGHDSMGDPQ